MKTRSSVVPFFIGLPAILASQNRKAALNEAESQTAEDSQTQGQEEQQDASVEEAQPA